MQDKPSHKVVLNKRAIYDAYEDINNGIMEDKLTKEQFSELLKIQDSLYYLLVDEFHEV